MDTFSPSAPPDYDGNSIKETPRLISNDFGDGYKQVIPDGLNANDATASFTWNYLSEADAAYIMQFYNAHIGKTFLWAAPGDFIGSGKWRMTDATASCVVYNLYSVVCNFERSFELS